MEPVVALIELHQQANGGFSVPGGSEQTLARFPVGKGYRRINKEAFSGPGYNGRNSDGLKSTISPHHSANHGKDGGFFDAIPDRLRG